VSGMVNSITDFYAQLKELSRNLSVWNLLCALQTGAFEHSRQSQCHHVNIGRPYHAVVLAMAESVEEPSRRESGMT
jgi:hypothetical protein